MSFSTTTSGNSMGTMGTGSSSSLSSSSSIGGKRRGRRGIKKSRRNVRKNKRGGSAGSAWNFVGQTVGSGNTQWNNVFQKGGPFGSEIQNASGTGPTNSAMANIMDGKSGAMLSGKSQSGGKKGGSKRSKKGGYWGQILSQAIVPFGLWGAQNKFSRRKGLFSSQQSKKNRH